MVEVIIIKGPAPRPPEDPPIAFRLSSLNGLWNIENVYYNFDYNGNYTSYIKDSTKACYKKTTGYQFKKDADGYYDLYLNDRQSNIKKATMSIEDNKWIVKRIDVEREVAIDKHDDAYINTLESFPCE